MHGCYTLCSKPVAKLYSQNSPVFSLHADSVTDRVYSIGNDNTVKVKPCCSMPHALCTLGMQVWHLLDHTCLFTLIPSLHKLSAAVECKSQT